MVSELAVALEAIPALEAGIVNRDRDVQGYPYRPCPLSRAVSCEISAACT